MMWCCEIAEAIIELGKTTSKYKTYRLPEGKTFASMLAKFGKPLGSETK